MVGYGQNNIVVIKLATFVEPLSLLAYNSFQRTKKFDVQGNYGTNYYTRREGVEYIEKVLTRMKNVFYIDPDLNELFISLRMSDIGIGATIVSFHVDTDEICIVRKLYQHTFTNAWFRHDSQRLSTKMDTIKALIVRMHEVGVVHRDLRPDNILYDDNGTLVLNDFGMSIETNSSMLRQFDMHCYDLIRASIGIYKTAKDVNMPSIIFINQNGEQCEDYIIERRVEKIPMAMRQLFLQILSWCVVSFCILSSFIV